MIFVDLSEAYANNSSQKQFQAELKKFMAGHGRCKALIQRLARAGTWEDQ
ncbi:MAG: hypothetical protein R2860_11700 [Desulfobacterales bacterium]